MLVLPIQWHYLLTNEELLGLPIQWYYLLTNEELLVLPIQWYYLLINENNCILCFKCAFLSYLQTTLISADSLRKVIHSSQLTEDFGGSLPYCHEEWIEIRMVRCMDVNI